MTRLARAANCGGLGVNGLITSPALAAGDSNPVCAIKDANPSAPMPMPHLQRKSRRVRKASSRRGWWCDIPGFVYHNPRRKETEFIGGALFRSAGCQPAVSPIANRRGVGTSNGQRVGNLRYSAARRSRNQYDPTTDEHGWTRIRESPSSSVLIRVHPWLKKSSRAATISGDTDRLGGLRYGRGSTQPVSVHRRDPSVVVLD